MAYHSKMLSKKGWLQVKLKNWFLNTFKVAAVDLFGGNSMHAMVLENVEEINENNCDEEYKIGDHKLTFKNTYDSEEYGQTKQVEMNANAAKAPKAFYYVHIDVDLDKI